MFVRPFSRNIPKYSNLCIVIHRQLSLNPLASKILEVSSFKSDFPDVPVADSPFHLKLLETSWQNYLKDHTRPAFV
uniref:Uncharacterized protein n=1 Tax=Acrobeloides nanus TaxID=290746 RepID=A0A914E9Q7_9BILA